MRLQEDTKIYAAPNSHLIWTVYTGLPVQSIAPLRRQFLNNYRGEIVYIDSPVSSDMNILRLKAIEETGLREGYRMAPEVAEQWLWLLRTRQYRETMSKNVGSEGTVRLESLPRFGEALLNSSLERAQVEFTRSSLKLLTRGFAVSNWLDWRAVIEYRFVSPELRRGARSNYSERLRGAEGVILTEADTVIYRSRWHPSERPDGIQFRFVPQSHWSVCPCDRAFGLERFK
jgi:hypothetical protein